MAWLVDMLGTCKEVLANCLLLLSATVASDLVMTQRMVCFEDTVTIFTSMSRTSLHVRA